METMEFKLQELSGFSFWNELAPLDHHWTLIGMVEAHKQPEIDLQSVRAFRLKGATRSNWSIAHRQYAAGEDLDPFIYQSCAA